MIHIPGRMEQDDARFHHAAQNVRFKPYYLLISGIFHLIFSDGGWPRVTETEESKSVDKRGLP